jgi:hypothetical protein
MQRKLHTVVLVGARLVSWEPPGGSPFVLRDVSTGGHHVQQLLLHEADRLARFIDLGVTTAFSIRPPKEANEFVYRQAVSFCLQN